MLIKIADIQTDEVKTLDMVEGAILLSGPSDVHLNISSDEIKSIAARGEDLVVILHDGTEILLENFYATDSSGVFGTLELLDGVVSSVPDEAGGDLSSGLLFVGLGAAAMVGGLSSGGGATSDEASAASVALAKIAAYADDYGKALASISTMESSLSQSTEDIIDALVSSVLVNGSSATLNQDSSIATALNSAIATALNSATDKITALAKIEAYNNGNGTSPAALEVADYTAAGVTGVTTDNVAAVNAGVLAASSGGADTVSEIQALVTAANAALTTIEAYNNGNGTSPAALEVADYTAAGVTGVTTDNVAAVNAGVLAASSGGADTVSEIQALVTAANAALTTIEAYNNGNGTSPAALEVADYTAAGVTGVTTDNVAAVNAGVLAASSGGADTVSEIQALVTAANAALTTIEAYNNGNGTSPAALEVADYTAAGVTGVTTDNVAAVNAGVLAASSGGADTVSEIQALVTAANAALTTIEAYNNGNGTSPAALEVADYTAAGVTGVTTDNVAAVNAGVLAASSGGADTVPEVQAIADAVTADMAADTALAKITAYADDNSTPAPTVPAPTVQDYIDAGVTGVDAANLNATNAAIDAVAGGDADTVPKVQAIADAANITADTALAKITAYADDNSTPAPTVQDYIDAGVTGVDAANLNATNAAIDAVAGGDADTVPKVQAIADAANITADMALAKITAYADDNSTPAPTVQDYIDAGVTGVDAANLNATNAAIDAVAGGDADTVPKVQAIADAANITADTALAKITAYADDNSTPAPTVQDYIDAGVTGVDAANLNATNAAIDAVAGGDADTVPKVQAIADAANITADTALAKITAYADDNSTPAPTVQDYIDAGVTGVDAANLNATNAAIDAVAGGDADTVPKVQAIADAANITADTALAKITAYADDNSTPALTVQDYIDAGVTGVDAANLNATNAAIDAVAGGDADTVPKVQAIADAANITADTALAKITAYADDNSTPAPTVQDYIDAGVTGVDAANLNATNAAIDAVAGGDADTVPKVQAIADAANITADTALAKITAYADDNSTPAPTVQDYIDAGVTGVDAANLNATNAAIDAVAGGDADTVPKVQAIADAVTADMALAKITAYADDNSTPAPTVQDYIDAGVTGVDAANLNATNAAIDAVAGGDADTVPEVQAIADAVTADMALAKITAYADDNSTPAPTVQDYIDAGVTGVDAANLNATNAAIDAVAGGDADTVPKVQAIADAANITADTALAKITAYADDNSTPAPTVQDYIDAGVTGVDAANLNATNAAIDAVAGGDADTVPKVQAIADAVPAAVIDLSDEEGFTGQLINPVEVLINGNVRIFYFWDVSNDGSANIIGDWVNHNSLDILFNGGGDTTNDLTERSYTMVDGTELRLPTLGMPVGSDVDTYEGVFSPAENQTGLDGLAAIKDAFDGTGTGTGAPAGWASDNYWSATLAGAGTHAELDLGNGSSSHLGDGHRLYVALEVV